MVLPALDTIPADSAVQFRTAEVAPNGDTLYFPAASWSSRDPDVAEVSPSGVVTGIRSGEVTIVALLGESSGSAEVRVERRFRARDVSTGSAGLCAVDLEGRLWCERGWGTGVAYPNADSTEIRTFLAPVSGSGEYEAVGSNSFFACGLTASGQVLCWGYQPLGDSLSSGIPASIASGLAFDTLSLHGGHGCGLVEQRAYCWGIHGDSLELVNTADAPWVRLDVQGHAPCGWTSSGVQTCWDGVASYPGTWSIVPPTGPGVPPLHASVSGGNSFCGLDGFGSAWCWGANTEGQLGNGTTVDATSPVQVAGNQHFTMLSAAAGGGGRVCGIAERNELFCWGTGFGPVPAAVLH
jgi:hypothetical protein